MMLLSTLIPNVTRKKNLQKYWVPFWCQQQKRIPGAQFFDIDAVADCQLKLPHMLPTPTYFKQCVENMGLNDTDEIVMFVFPSAPHLQL